MAAWCDSLIVYLLGFALISTSSGSICPPGWRKWQKSCYAMFLYQLTWLGASNFCGSKGSHLVVPNSKPENDFVWGMLLESAVPESKLERAVWIGCKRDFDTLNFKCSGDSEVMSFTNWAPEYPSSQQNDTCVRYPKNGNGRWKTSGCDWPRHFACEMPTTPRLYCTTTDANGRLDNFAP